MVASRLKNKLRMATKKTESDNEDPHGKFRLDVYYPLPIDDEIETQLEAAVGHPSGSSGGGGSRDTQFYFESNRDKKAAAIRIAKLGLPNVSVVQ